MNKFYCLLTFVFTSLSAFSQMYILNEDFSNTSGTTPPPNWHNITVNGGSGDVWHFDNPGERTINYPVIEPFAIFDSENYSDNGEAEEVSLETPFIDASASDNVLLSFHHTLNAGVSSKCQIYISDGSDWFLAGEFTQSTGNPHSEIIDISAFAGGITNTKIRFTWKGNGSGYWAIDNIRVLMPLPVDAGVVSIDAPFAMYEPGLQEVKVTLGNFGYEAITNTKILWTVNGIPQADYDWSGNIEFSQTQSDIVIGNYDFQSGLYSIIAWQELPNGQPDPNPNNDTAYFNTASKLCGFYTIGGVSPDFATFQEASTALNLAGISCPVVFNVRDGVYDDFIELNEIEGSSETNTITFTSESQNNLMVSIKSTSGHAYIVDLKNTKNVIFDRLGFGFTPQGLFGMMNYCDNIQISNCLFTKGGIIRAILANTGDVKIQNNEFQGDITINMSDGLQNSISDILITDNIFASNGTCDINLDKPKNALIQNNDMPFGSIAVSNALQNVIIRSNQIQDGGIQASGAGIREISGNRITRIKSTSGISISDANETTVFNNFIHLSKVDGAEAIGLKLSNTSNSTIYFNSINLDSDSPQSQALKIENCSGLEIENNIFSNPLGGVPVYIDSDIQDILLNYNDYYSQYDKIAFYNDSVYTSIEAWREVSSGDENSYAVKPYFAHPDDPTISQILLNNSAIPIEGIDIDIDNIVRELTPDIGAKEFDPCEVDAGIAKIIKPGKIIEPGISEVVVRMQNHGTEDLTSATINWMVGDEMQAPYNWSGILESNESDTLTIGTYDFQVPSAAMMAWTDLPNGIEDCEHSNDTAKTTICGPMCGDYTIGGPDANYANFSEAVEDLIIAGISCSVLFNVRDGSYEDNVKIPIIQGTSEENIITFIAENNDSTKIDISSANLELDYIFHLDSTKFVSFSQLGFGQSSGNIFKISHSCENLKINGGYFRNGCKIRLFGSNHQQIEISNNYILSGGSIHVAANPDSVVSHLEIKNNLSEGESIFRIFLSGAENVSITNNNINKGAITVINNDNGESIIIGNNISSSIYGGINISGTGIKIISNNSISQISGGSALGATNLNEALIFNNFFNTSETNSANTVSLSQLTNCKFFFNTITNFSENPVSSALLFEGCNNNNFVDNIFASFSPGYCINLDDSPENNEWDYNDYFSKEGNLAFYQDEIITEFSKWKNLSGGDNHSLNVDPDLLDSAYVHFSNTELNNKGIPYENINFDIIGSPRDFYEPDPGAKEYSPCLNDASLKEVLEITNPLTSGIHEVKVLLANNGTEAINSLVINWDVNEISQETLNWTGALASNETIEVSLGSFDFSNQVFYTINVLASLPNGTEDCAPGNDSCSIFLAKQLCGTYTIGGTAPDFETLQLASMVLNTGGISCPVVFKIRDGNYIDYSILNNIEGVSEEATITFESESADSSAVTIEMYENGSGTIFTIAQTEYLYFRNLGFGLSANTFVFSNSSHVSIQNCLFSSLSGIKLACGSNQHFEISHNNFSSGGLISLSGSSSNPVQDINVAKNVFLGNNISYITAYEITNSNIDSNSISRGQIDIIAATEGDVFIRNNTISSGNNRGLRAQGQAIREISGNKIANVFGNGMEIRNVDNLLLANNFVHVFGVGSTYGISFQQGTDSKIVFNSISVDSYTNSTLAFGISNSSDLVVKNNIFSNSGGGLPVSILQTEDFDWDFNDYYSTTGEIGQLDYEVFTELSEWGLSIDGDANSDFVNPFFISSSELRPHQRQLNGAGIAVPGLLLDIDGEIRNNIAPDVGADEFMVDFGVTQLLNPTLDCHHGNFDSVTVFLRQFGDIPFINLKLAFQLNGGEIHYETIPGTISNDIVFTFQPTVNISPEGEYKFKIWLQNTQDDNLNNDTLYATRYSYPSPDVDFTYNNHCTWTEVHFEGEASIGGSYSIESYEWDFGEGEISTQKNTSHLFPGMGDFEVNFKAFTNKGCYGDTTKIVSIDRLPVAMDFEIKNEVCNWDCTGEVTINASGGEQPYSFFIDGNPILDNHATGLCHGDYLVKIEDGMNCTFTDTFNIAAEINPDLSFTASPTEGFAPLLVEFEYTGSGAEDLSLHFGDGSSSVEMPTSHIYNEYGDFQALCIGSSGSPHNCVDTSMVEIFVDVVLEITAPDIFTPNGDANMDYFFFETIGIKELHAWIYDRWGGLACELEDLDSKWDGSLKNGNDAADGIYYYVAEAVGVNKEEIKKEGSVLLVREVLDIFPNPATNNAVLNLSGLAPGSRTIEIYNISGFLVMKTNSADDNVNLDLHDFPTGMYVIRVYDHKNIYFAKLLKK
jgi:gliding motility-associated-like protein